MQRCLGCMEEYSGEYEVCPNCGYAEDTPAKEPYHITPGVVLQGKYIVGRVLGYGGFGVTYLGYDNILKRKIAIKEYLPTDFSTRMPGETKLTVYSGAAGEQFTAGLKSFVEEAHRLAKFNSLPGIVDIYDSFSENNTGYIIMEYLEGKTVKEMLKENGTFTFERAKEIVLAVLAPLKEVHKEGIIHRDIAPDNIFITDDNTVKLIDFGASRYATTLHSKSLSVLLKPGYAPEEQYRSRGQQGPWTDMYALSVTFYKMLTGITPEEALERRVKDAVKEPSKLGAVLPQSAENAIMNAMNVNIEERTQSAEAFEQALTADDVTRIKGTRLNQDTGRIPLWMKISAAVLAAAILTTSILVATGVINLRGGFLDLGGKYVTAEGYVTVPEVLKKTVAEAQSITEDKGLLFQITDKRYDDTGLIPKDRVLLQDPSAGRDVLIGSILGVVVSGGKEKVFVPNVIDKMKDMATAELEALGFKVEFTEEFSDTAPGAVLKQTPAAETEADKGSTVAIVISKGREDIVAGQAVIVPGVVGKDFENAKTLLIATGLYIVKGAEVYSDTIPAGQITLQNPAANTKSQTGKTVTVTVSLGRQKVRVPDVQYKSEQAAKDLITSAKLKVQVQYEESSTIQKGNVIRQNTAAGTQVDVNSTIVITVSSGSKKVDDAIKNTSSSPNSIAAASSRPTTASTSPANSSQAPSSPAQSSQPQIPSSQGQGSSVLPPAPIVNTVGNTPGNITNGGYAAIQGDWIYYSNVSDGYKLYRIKTDGTGKQKLNDYKSIYINVVGDWIYYRNSSYGGIYRMKTDGSDIRELSSGWPCGIYVVGDWIYFSNNAYHGALGRMKTDGSEYQSLSSDVWIFNVVGDWVYYVNGSTSRLFRVKTDGSGNQKLCDDYISGISVVGGWIYYNSGSILYRMKTDGSGRQEVSNNVSYINVVDDWVYCMSLDDSYKLYRIKTDGSGRQKLSDDYAATIVVVGDWIYYPMDSELELYRIRTDGTQRQIVT